MYRLFSNASFDFIGLRQRAYVASGLALALALVIGLVWQFSRGSWLNYGVDFSGGTLVQVTFNQPTEVSQVRAAIEPVLPGTQISRFGDENGFIVRTPVIGETTSGAAERVPEILAANFPTGSFTIDRVEAVGAKVGGELQARATLAILLSFIATLIYLAFRFEWRFGLAAVIATAHDIMLTLGFISIFQLEVALTTVAAVLTIVGYSLNDTIIIFDRIRENLHGPGKRQDMDTVLNRSINETLPRTVVTSGTTLVTLVALTLFGGAIIRDFGLIMIVGIVLGTYSSIFVAAPALREIEKRWPRERKKPRRVTAPARAGT
ncbi:MAG: protein translocase subunit SecF [Gemmatimonadetes bacterium]|nr:protein translocase subunit SecF [Gemmatimonadota bacterium]